MIWWRPATTPQKPEQPESAKRLSLARLKRRATSISLCPTPIGGADLDQRVVMIPVLALSSLPRNKFTLCLPLGRVAASELIFVSAERLSAQRPTGVVVILNTSGYFESRTVELSGNQQMSCASACPRVRRSHFPACCGGPQRFASRRVRLAGVARVPSCDRSDHREVGVGEREPRADRREEHRAT